MKKLFTLTGIAGIGAVLALISACQSTGTSGGVATSQQGQAAGNRDPQIVAAARGPSGQGTDNRGY
jgi:hypothetical protein